jgi:transposase
LYEFIFRKIGLKTMTTNSEERPRGARLQPHPPELKERGYRLYEKGKPNREIAAELGIPVATLARWSSKGKWKLRRQLAGHAEAGLNALVPINQDSLAEISQLTFEEKQTRYDEMMSEHALRFAYVVKGLSPQGVVVNADKISKLDTVARKALKLEESRPAVLLNVALLARPMPSRLVEAREIPNPELPPPQPAPDVEQSR